MLVLELGTAFVAGGVAGMTCMAIMAALGNEKLFVENRRLERANQELRDVVRAVTERRRERVQ